MQVLSFKVTDEQADFVRNLARRKNKTLSEYLRALAFPRKTKEEKPTLVLKRHPVSGCVYNAGHYPRIPTQEELDAALKDYL